MRGCLAAASGLSGRFTSQCCDLAGDIDGSFELICANIVADIVIRLIPDTGRLLSKGGKLILSGIITERRPDVDAALSRYGYYVADSRELGGWCVLTAARNN